MSSSFGDLLRECRLKADLTQQELADKIDIDATMISKLERGRITPNPSTLHEIITALATEDIPRETPDQLWEAAGFSYPKVFDTPVADPIVPFINQNFEKMDDPEKRKLLGDDLRRGLEVNQADSSAERASEQRRWAFVEKTDLSLIEQLERRNAPYFLRSYKRLGRSFYSRGLYAQAIQAYDTALLNARRLNDLYQEAEIFILQGDAQRRRGGRYWDIAHTRYNQAKEIFQNLNARVREAYCLRKIAGVYLFQGKPNEALPLCEKSLNICRKENDNRGIYKALQHMTWAFDMLGHWSRATKLCEEALSIVRKMTSDKWELVAALRYLGDAYRIERLAKFTGNEYIVKRRLEEAEQTYKEALDILQKHSNEEIRDKLDSGLARLGLGKIYLKQPGRELEAKLYLNEGMRLHLELGEDFRVADFLSEQGSLLLKLRQLPEAEMRLQSASNLFKELDNVFHQAHTLASLCELYYEKKDGFEKIYSIAEVARRIDNGLINYHLARIELIVGKAQVGEGQYSNAVKSFCTASRKALDFNYESFGEVCNDILDEIEQIARGVSPEVAIKICDSLLQCWEIAEETFSQQQPIQESIEAIQRKKEKVETLTPIK